MRNLIKFGWIFGTIGVGSRSRGRIVDAVVIEIIVEIDGIVIAVIVVIARRSWLQTMLWQGSRRFEEVESESQMNLNRC